MTFNRFTALSVGWIVILVIRWYRRVKDLPPSPMKLPLVGNLFNLPTDLDSGKLARMGKDYDSEILHFEALGNSIVVLNSRRVAEELLDKRSAIYSSRPQLPMFSLSGWDFQLVLLPYGDRWRTSRKIFTQFFNSPDSYQGRVTSYLHKYLTQLLESPDAYFAHTRQLLGSLALDITYGMKVESSNDPYVKLAEEAAAEGAALFSSTYLVDALPVLRHLPQWFPGAGFQRRAARSRYITGEVKEKPFRAVVDMMKTGRYQRSLVSATLEDPVYANADPGILKGVAGAVYLAAADTSVSSLGTFFLAMVTHPGICKKAQQELDAVLLGLLPTHKDLSSLPYLTAVVLEVYRWRPVAHLGSPHAVMSEDFFESYRIPAGSTIVANQWAMLHDERDYPNPEKFDPERFLKDGRLNSSVKNPMDIAFGFGRRLCPGRQMGHSTIMLTAASVLSLFDLEKKVDEYGNVIEPTGEYVTSLLSQPREFPCTIKPRSQHARELILSLSESS